jgi:hypothetical protein
MKRSETTSRTLARQERAESRNFFLVLLLIVGAVALIQVLLFLTVTRLEMGSGNFLQHVRGTTASSCDTVRVA